MQCMKVILVYSKIHYTLHLIVTLQLLHGSLHFTIKIYSNFQLLYDSSNNVIHS